MQEKARREAAKFEAKLGSRKAAQVSVIRHVHDKGTLLDRKLSG